MLVLIKGAGDLASGVAHRFARCGIKVVMTEIAQPTTVRCAVAFSRAIYEGTAVVEGMTARLAKNAIEAKMLAHRGEIAVLVDPNCECLRILRPHAVIDARIAKQNLGTTMEDAPIVVALGPGFSAGIDCHAVVETKRGHDLGRVIFSGEATANTGVPGDIGGYTHERLLRAPEDGIFAPIATIGQLVKAGDVVAKVDGEPVVAKISGVVRGLLPEGTPVRVGMKAGDVDPRGIVDYCSTISDKARAIAGGVLEAVFCLREEGGEG